MNTGNENEYPSKIKDPNKENSEFVVFRLKRKLDELPLDIIREEFIKL